MSDFFDRLGDKLNKKSPNLEHLDGLWCKGNLWKLPYFAF